MKLQKILAMLAIAGAVSLFAAGTASQSDKTSDLKEKGLQEKKLEKKVKEDVKKVKDVIKTKTK